MFWHRARRRFQCQRPVHWPVLRHFSNLHADQFGASSLNWSLVEYFVLDHRFFNERHAGGGRANHRHRQPRDRDGHQSRRWQLCRDGAVHQSDFTLHSTPPVHTTSGGADARDAGQRICGGRSGGRTVHQHDANFHADQFQFVAGDLEPDQYFLLDRHCADQRHAGGGRANHRHRQSRDRDGHQSAPGSYADTVLFTNQTTQDVQPRQFTLQISQPMILSSASGFAFAGPVGGPFGPVTSKNYQLTNTSVASLTWGIVNTSSWLNVSSTGGTLAGSSQTSVTVNLAAADNTLPYGTYTATILVTNSMASAFLWPSGCRQAS